MGVQKMNLLITGMKKLNSGSTPKNQAYILGGGEKMVGSYEEENFCPSYLEACPFLFPTKNISHKTLTRIILICTIPKKRSKDLTFRITPLRII